MSIQSSRTVIHQEAGIALLGSVLVAALVLGLAGWGILNMTKVAQQTVYGESAANQARTAALIGIQAVTGYAQSVYVGNNPSTASLGNLFNAPGLSNNDGPVNQLFTQPTNASVQAMITANTFSSVTAATGSGTTGSTSTSGNGYIRMLSTGRSGSAIQTAEAYIVAQLNSLNKYNANLILGSGSTFNGNLNKDGISNIIVASTAPTIQQAGITLNGTTYTYIPISYFPVINPQEFAQYATIQLNSDGTITVASSASNFYSTLSSLATPSSTDYFSYTPATTTTTKIKGVTTTSTTPPTWTINQPINAFIYTPDDININFIGTAQLTVISGGVITVSNTVTLNPFAYYISSTASNTSPVIPATVTATTSSISPGSVCDGYSSLPVCDGTVPYPNLQGLVLLSSGGLEMDKAQGSTFNGDVATAGTLNLNGGGSYTIGGTIIAENGVTSTKGSSANGSSTVNGGINLTAPIAAANSATLGGYQLTPSSIRWTP
ncbi:hypothetical protein H7F10_16220 [Acidithiobacillus sp. HP-6]|uniref:hypothetical protein n=1 Tax=unclassified Acidithiobacillus TaxID=2614800 RepID=UPI00187A54A2|nr:MULTISPECIES: hypothetical protein [unclassified Acidithiobacillus]MBE7564428.1 hypothetical protein [Acidithiobacillus sp. HP-6]MBE7570382.1 hypothetical protein [Acidithiobacillus sp. HP-2]